MSRVFYVVLTLVVVLIIALFGYLIVMGMFVDEYWCEDRWPWWGPPEDPNSTCSGHAWESRHPGEFPWTLPK